MPRFAKSCVSFLQRRNSNADVLTYVYVLLVLAPCACTTFFFFLALLVLLDKKSVLARKHSHS